MSSVIRIMQAFALVDAKGNSHSYQNYFVNLPDFAPFQVDGDNSQIKVLFPATKYAIRLVEKGDGNRKSQLTLTTNFITESEQVGALISQEIYVGIGASFSESTVELRFNTAVDAVASNFPAQRLNEENVGILPLDSSLSLR